MAELQQRRKEPTAVAEIVEISDADDSAASGEDSDETTAPA